MEKTKNKWVFTGFLAAACLLIPCFGRAEELIEEEILLDAPEVIGELEEEILDEAEETEKPERFQSTITKDEDGNFCVDFADVTVILPASWSGKCELQVNGEDSVSFYQKKSRDLWTEELGYPNGGHLFTVCFSRYLDYLELPSYRTLGATEEGYYYVDLPTDFQAYAEDDDAVAEFQEMMKDQDQVLDQISMKNTGIPEESGYILPLSSTEYLTEEDLAGLNKDQLQMAVNEIYARRHRKFTMPEVREYFEDQEWYSGYIEAEDFNAAEIMNAYECANLNLLVEKIAELS